VKRVKLGLLLVLGVSLGLFLAQPLGRADEKKEKEDVKPAVPTAETTSIENLRAAYTLVRLGKADKMPEALITAARIIGTTGASEFDEGAKIDATTDKDVNVEKEALALLDTAENIAKGRPTESAVKTLVDAARRDVKEAKRGATGAPKTFYGKVTSREQRETFHIPFHGGEWGRIFINNYTHRGDIDVRVYDSGGRRVARDFRSHDDPHVSFFVPRREVYRVEVRFFAERGPLRYRLSTN